MAKTTTYRIMCNIPGTRIETKIEAREMTVKEGAYQFWAGEYGETNRLIASYPVGFTVIETDEPAVVDPWNQPTNELKNNDSTFYNLKH